MYFGIDRSETSAAVASAMGTITKLSRALLGSLGLAILVVLGLFFLGTRIEGLLSRNARLPLPPLSAQARALHDSSPVVDLHADPLLWGRDLLERSDVGHVDLPRLRDGNVAVQVLGIVTAIPVPTSIERTDPRWPDAITLLALAHRWPLETFASRKARALHQARRFTRMTEESEGRLIAIRSRADLERLLESRSQGRAIAGGLPAIEGAHALDGDPASLAALFDAGIRMVGLAHFTDNEFAGSAHGVQKGGLTPKGRTLIAEAERRGMAIDLAHASATTITEVLAIAKKPPVVSHTGVRGTCDNQRNLSDEQVRAIAGAGGVIGIGFWDTAACGIEPADIARAIKYVVDLVGDDHAALGSDFDGAVTTGIDASGLPALTQALLDAGLPADSIRKVLGGNALRVLRQTLPAGSV